MADTVPASLQFTFERSVHREKIEYASCNSYQKILYRVLTDTARKLQAAKDPTQMSEIHGIANFLLSRYLGFGRLKPQSLYQDVDDVPQQPPQNLEDLPEQ